MVTSFIRSREKQKKDLLYFSFLFDYIPKYKRVHIDERIVDERLLVL
jgi:hypothetical protein